MKIAMLRDNRGAFDSLTHVYGAMEAILGRRHEMVRLPPAYAGAGEAEQHRMNADLVRRCDLVLAAPDVSFLQARESVGKHVPFLVLLLGGAPRGMPHLTEAWRYLTTKDVLIGNCGADVEITRAFFPNARPALLPFSFDEARFFATDLAERRRIRAAHGFLEADRVLLYAGRIILEKNIHTLLLVFSVLQKMDPRIHLVIAGPPYDTPFEDFGVYPIDFTSALDRMTDRIGIDKGRLHLMGRQTGIRLRKLYGMADVFVNMTLHHDENFGLAQVEAMACGTPVVCTNWGGLKDTVLQPATGSKVETVVTRTGVKSNWLEAASKILEMVGDPEIGALRKRCRQHAEERYSRRLFEQHLEEMIRNAAGHGPEPGAPLQISRLGREVWKLCPRVLGEPAPYRRGARSLALYRRLIGPYAGGTRPTTKVIGSDQSVYLAWPTRQVGQRGLEISDPMFPMTVPMPAAFGRMPAEAIRALRKSPVIAISRLIASQLKPNDRIKMRKALQWMLKSGVLLTLDASDAHVLAGVVSPAQKEGYFSVKKGSVRDHRYILRRLR